MGVLGYVHIRLEGLACGLSSEALYTQPTPPAVQAILNQCSNSGAMVFKLEVWELIITLCDMLWL